MTKIDFILIFPSLFMLHELEEMIFMPSFVVDLQHHKRLPMKVRHFISKLSAFHFNLIVAEEFLLLLFFSLWTGYFQLYTVYAAMVLAYVLHIIGHICQCCLIRKYVPGTLTGIFTSIIAVLILIPWQLDVFKLLPSTLLAFAVMMGNLY
jgi:hypothetical protein